MQTQRKVSRNSLNYYYYFFKSITQKTEIIRNPKKPILTKYENQKYCITCSYPSFSQHRQWLHHGRKYRTDLNFWLGLYLGLKHLNAPEDFSFFFFLPVQIMSHFWPFSLQLTSKDILILAAVMTGIIFSPNKGAGQLVFLSC